MSANAESTGGAAGLVGSFLRLHPTFMAAAICLPTMLLVFLFSAQGYGIPVMR